MCVERLSILTNRHSDGGFTAPRAFLEVRPRQFNEINKVDICVRQRGKYYEYSSSNETDWPPSRPEIVKMKTKKPRSGFALGWICGGSITWVKNSAKARRTSKYVLAVLGCCKLEPSSYR